MARKPFRPSLDRYPYHAEVSTRFSDNDVYQHLNNAVYYQFYDAIINQHMMEKTSWNPALKRGEVLSDNAFQKGLVVASSTEYLEIIDGFPKPVTLGLAVTRLGKSSVEYEIGVFQGDKSLPAKALGRFVHCFVDIDTGRTRPEGMPFEIRDCLAKLIVEPLPKL
jgi:acyl-CoA thioester hydrolase